MVYNEWSAKVALLNTKKKKEFLGSKGYIKIKVSVVKNGYKLYYLISYNFLDAKKCSLQ